MPAVEEDGDVMVPVQEDERFLVNYDEEGIKQLREFAKDEKLDPKTRRSAPVCDLGILAQIISKAHGTQIMEQLRQCPGHTYPRKCRQTEIP
mmetsp:Transcript_18978/g.41348  ORF Transcript_18978/g.41348 Transcript_18978/m.41348 type:complete len:92 (+) Transcript_18978:558-833(+)